jgi:hypothetical protein
MFDRLMALWVFTATFLSSIVLVPIMMALFWKGKRTSLAGVLSCAVGLVSVIAYYVGLSLIGVENEVYGTYIWTFSILGVSISLWQEYALFFSLPMSLLGFVLGNLLSRGGMTAPPEGSQ